MRAAENLGRFIVTRFAGMSVVGWATRRTDVASEVSSPAIGVTDFHRGRGRAALALVVRLPRELPAISATAVEVSPGP
jgi:hypothetical protein